jgi:AraC-like DNA-binding protein
MRWILLLYALICFLVAGGLLFRKSRKSMAFLGLFALLFGFEIVDFLYSTSQLKYTYPQFYAYYYLPSGFLYGPILLWHFRRNIEEGFRLSFWHLAHLLPFFIVLVYLWPMFTMPALERIAFISENFLDYIMPVNYARAFHLLLYGIVLIAYLYKNRYSLHPKRKLYAWSIILIYFISSVVISWLTQFANSWRDFAVYYFVACNIIIVIGILLYTDPVFLTDFAQKYLKSAISKKDKKRIRTKIVTAFEEENAFARNDLNLSVLGEIIGEKNHHISQTFSDEMEEGFHSYVNRHRIEYAKVLLTHPDYQNYTIEAIGQEAGFNNRVSFYKAFRQFTSTTPSEYRKGRLNS